MSQQAYAALGDSLTAGQGDPDAQGRPVGWARRLCSLLTAQTGQPYLFTNLAVNRASVAGELMEQANDAIRCAARTHGVLFVDAWYSGEVADPAFWSEDRVHPNA